MREIIDWLFKTSEAEKDGLLAVLNNTSQEYDDYLFKKADEKRREFYGDSVYIRGLIEFTNHCRNNCFYCGIRAENTSCERYRLTKDEILSCCETGYKLGFRTFVLQGGEDLYFTDDVLCGIISEIKMRWPECAVTLSIGEKPRESFKRYFDAGADRFLLRHETATEAHYGKLHPKSMSFKKRMDCLKALKEIGFQVGAGMMVGSPFQTKEELVSDLIFLKEFRPHMVGIGPFLPHSETPFADMEKGSFRDTLVMVALTRLLIPKALIPSTTALGTISPDGRELGLKAGANVVMPNLSPAKFREQYSLYDGKISTGAEAAEGLSSLSETVRKAGYKIEIARGDSLM